MPTKPISARARLLAYFATANVAESMAVLEDAHAILAERKRLGGAKQATTGAGTANTGKAMQPGKPAADKPNGKAPKATGPAVDIHADL